jgi:hypothetical protein
MQCVTLLIGTPAGVLDMGFLSSEFEVESVEL